MSGTILSPSDLLQFVEVHLPEFEKPRLLPAGNGFHYTPFRSLIERSEKFFGAPITENLHQTQDISEAKPALHDPGVIFAYASEAKCRQEGCGQDIVNIQYRGAVETMQHAERIYLEDLRRRHGYTYMIEPTLLILTSGIIRYSFMDARTRGPVAQ